MLLLCNILGDNLEGWTLTYIPLLGGMHDRNIIFLLVLRWRIEGQLSLDLLYLFYILLNLRIML